MLVSYIIGNKYFPVNYDLKRILGYLFLALGLYAGAAFLEIRNNTLDLIIKNLLLVFFGAVVFLFERKKLFGKTPPA
jgi:hypothetical protein